MALPWMSVIMPTYNGAEYVRAAMESVVAQDARDVEFIVVDDGSTDESLSIVRSYASQASIAIIQPGRLGNWVAVTNIGMKAAQGKYLCWLHNDDTWLPGRLAAMRALVERVPDAALYAHSCRYIDHRGRVVGLLRAPLPAGRPLPPAAVVPKMLAANFFAPPAILFPRWRAEAVGWMDDRLWYVADWDFGLKLAALGATVYHDAPLAGYRIHAASMTTRGAHRVEELRRMFDLVLGRHANGVARAAEVSAADIKIARFSMEVNLVLASLASGGGRPSPGFLWHCLTLGPVAWGRYLRRSRILERAASRLRVGLTSP